MPENENEKDKTVVPPTEEEKKKTNIELHNEKKKTKLKADTENEKKKKEGEEEVEEKEAASINEDENKKQIEELNKELIGLRTFKANRLKEIDDYEGRLKAQRTKEDQKLKGFKEEKKSEGDKTVIAPLYGKMSFKNLTEKTKQMRKK